ncbi:SO4C1 protein, partial [Amia calva]|nr:SO4C1 protein [Amia calva]
MAFSAFMIGLGAFVFSTPHYNTGIYKYGSEIKDTCAFPVSNSSEKSCDSSRLTTVSSYLYVFILGQLLMGVGGTALYTLGTAYIDDSVPSEKSSLYIGIGNGTAVLGPAIGYVAGGYILNIYIDINKGTTVDLTPEDPRWLGAWWIAFLISWPIAWLLVIPFCGFPKHLQGTAAIEQQKVSQAHQDGSEKVVLTLNVGKTFHDFPLALKLLVKNPVFVCLSIAASMEGFLIGGLATFIPKYIENQFGTTSSYAALLGGFVLIPGAALGQLIGGLVVSKFKLKCKQIIYFAIGTCIASFLMSMIFVVTKCKDIPFAGISVDYNRTGTATNLIAPCNAQCGCDNTYYNPVCGDDGIQYLSACNAGCRNISLQRNSMVFHNCSCVSFKHALSSENNRAFGGKCDTECNMKAAFTGLSLLFAIFTFMAATPNTTATLRCVPLTQRSFALGVQWVFIRLLGTIPGPMILGAAIDHTCILWNINSCGDKGACWSYNNTRMAYSLAIMCK